MARHEALEATASRSYPWDALGLSRADRVIAFLEDLEITAGKHARTKLRLRQWQRRFVEAVYREDKRGIRPIRTAVLTMARKNGKSQLAAALRSATSAVRRRRAAAKFTPAPMIAFSPAGFSTKWSP